MVNLKPSDIPADFPVRPLQPGDTAQDRVTDNTCGLSWDDAVGTTWTPAPSGRCPFEYFHGEEEKPGPLKLGDKINGTIIAHRPDGRREAVILVWRGADYPAPFAVACVPADRHVTSWGQGYYHASIVDAVDDWQSYGKR